MVLAFGAAGAAGAQSLTFEHYYPNRVEETLVFDYATSAEGTAQWTYAGTMTRSPAGSETHNALTYQTLIHATEGLPDFYPKEWKTYHRETGEGLYTGQMNDQGALEEYLEFPITAESGERWTAQSEFWESETAVVLPETETAIGIFEQCIRVERVRHDHPSGQTLTNSTTYCPGVSAVYSIVEHRTEEFRSVTEIELVEIQP